MNKLSDGNYTDYICDVSDEVLNYINQQFDLAKYQRIKFNDIIDYIFEINDIFTYEYDELPEYEKQIVNECLLKLHEGYCGITMDW